MQLCCVSAHKTNQTTVVKHITLFPKRYHDVSRAVIETGKSQRGHITPHLKRSGKSIVNDSAIHVWGIVKDPVEEIK